MNRRTALAVIGAAPLARAETRPFRIGFTPAPHDETPQAWAEMVGFLRQNGDIVLQHLWGVPWTEALRERPFHPHVMADWKRRKALTAGGLRTYLAVTPLNMFRNDVSEYTGEKENMPVPAELKGKPLDHPMMKKAYLGYCRRAIDFFEPDYACIGIEVNSFHHPSRARRWPEYVNLHRHVYTELKKRHAALPVFATLDLHAMLAPDNPDREGMLAAYLELMDANDMLAFSFYPFFRGLTGKMDESLAWVTDTFDRYAKPYAVAETGEQAADVTVPVGNREIRFAGSVDGQKRYFEKALSLARRRDFRFFIAWFYRDPRAVERYGWAPWRRCGLLDDDGKPRPAYAVWRKYVEMPYRR